MKAFVLALSFFSLAVPSAKAQNYRDTAYLKKKVQYTPAYTFIDTTFNYIQYHTPDALSHFFEKLTNANRQKVRILHIGDSHLQADIGASFSRNILQELFGYGGRGSIFPYTIAKTHATYDYEVIGSGVWERSRNIDSMPTLDLGMTGITARTMDTSASFEIQFIKDRAKIQSNFKKLKLFCKVGKASFNCLYRLDSSSEWKRVDCDKYPTGRACIEINLDHAPASIAMRVSKSDSSQNFFEIYGLSLESDENKGILYHSVGINGAKLKSFLKENLYESQIKEFTPDLVIVDLIANDLAFGEFNVAEIETYLKSVVDKIRASSPDASIMLVGMQDIYVKNRNITNAGAYSGFLKRFAAFNGVAFYDYYMVSGGAQSMKKWFSKGLSAKDKCHLSTQGYQLKGELFTNAILKSYLHYLKDKNEALVIFK